MQRIKPHVKYESPDDETANLVAKHEMTVVLDKFGKEGVAYIRNGEWRLVENLDGIFSVVFGELTVNGQSYKHTDLLELKAGAKIVAKGNKGSTHVTLFYAA